MNKIGLWLIKTQTIGTAVSSVAVTNAFSSDYDNYKIIVSGGAGSANANSLLTLGATATGYYYGFNVVTYSTGVVSSGGGNNAASFIAGYGATTGINVNIDIMRPQAADETVIYSNHVYAATTGYGGYVCGFLNNTTQYTDFTLTPSSGTYTGGTIYVYGYRD